MKPNGIVFDKLSARSTDADGRMHVAKTHISKANVCPYYGKEIPDYEALGLDPNKVYRLWRCPDALEKAAASFKNLPLLRRHVVVSAADPMKDDVVGSIGSDVTFTAPYLDASLCIWDAQAIAGVEAGQIEELSSAYRYTPVMESGVTPDGDAYDGKMTELVGNHLALVERGRAGSDVVVADSNPFKEKTAMKKTAIGRALTVAFSAASPKLAQDAALPKLLGGAVKVGFDKAHILKQILAMDEEMDKDKAGEIIDAVMSIEENPKPQEPADTMPDKMMSNDNDMAHEKIMSYLRDKLDAPSLEAIGMMLKEMAKPAGDEDMMKPEAVDEKVEAAMDSMRKEFRELERAKTAVRPIVGDVVGMDSAEQVYRFALGHLRVEHKDMPAAGLGRLFTVASDRKAPPQPIATDSASVAKIPGLDRFRSI